MKWLEYFRLQWKLIGLELDYEDMTGPKYYPPNACCPECFHGSALTAAEDKIEEVRQALKALK